MVAAGAFAAAAGTAWATGAVSSIVGADGTINGCYQAAAGDDGDGRQGQLRVVAAGEQCKKNEQAIQWSQRGPKGDTGAQGVAGQAGLKGDTGAPGATGAKGDSGTAGATGLAGLQGAAGSQGPKGDKGDDGAAGGAGVAGSNGVTGNSGPPGPPGPPGGGATIASLDALAGIPCGSGAGAGVTQIAYANANGAVAFTCAATTLYTLTVVVSGTHIVRRSYWAECGSNGPFGVPDQCEYFVDDVTPNYATVSPSGARCSGTCTYSIPGGTQVSIAGTGTLSAGGSSFTMTANKTVTVS